MFVCLVSRKNLDVPETSSRGAPVSETLSVRPVVTIPVLLVNAVWYNFCIYCTPLTNLTLILFCAIMDRLLPEMQEQLKKISTARLIANLGRAEYNLNRLEELERADLLEALAKTMLVDPAEESETDLIREAREASQVYLPVGESSTTTSEGGSAAVRLRELKLEEKRAKREKRKAAREAKGRRLPVRLRPKDLL